MDKKKIFEVFNRIFQSNGKYLLALVLFIIWMLFFDGNRLSNQIELTNKSEQLQEDIKSYKGKIEKAKADQIDLEVNKEKYAREKHLLHKPDEDVFIIEKKNNNEK